MSAGLSSPKHEEVGAFYNAANDLITRFQGGSMHYGYWNGPDDDSSFEQAAERLTDIMIEKLGASPGDRVLDVGCGTGKPGVQLARSTGAEVVGISISTGDVERATALAERENCSDRVRFQHANAMEVPFPDNSFDHVLALESIVHMPDRVQVLKEINRVLRPGGRIVLTDFATRNTGSDGQEKASLVKKLRKTIVGKLTDIALTKVLESWHTADLITAADYPSFASAAQLAVVEVTDISQHTKYTAYKFYQPVYEFAKNNDVPPEITKILKAGPGPNRLEWLIEDDPSVGVLLVVLRKPAAE